jgi:hypothetical protein
MRFVAFIFSLLTAAFLNAQEDNALHFDGVNDYVNLDDISGSVSDLNEFTVEFWLKYDHGNNDDYETFFSVNQNDGTNRFLIRNAELSFDGIDSTVVVYINEGGVNQYIVGSTVVGDMECHHIAFTYKAGACSLYVDGLLDASANHTFSISETDRLSLGQEYDLGPVTSAFYEGEMEDFRFWNIAKSQSEIFSAKDSEALGSEPNLLCNLTFNQGIPSGDNTSISEVTNTSDLGEEENGILINFSQTGAASNFVRDLCSGNSSTNSIRNDSSISNIDSAFSIFPNPTTGSFYVKSNLTGGSITILAMSGKIIRSKQLLFLGDNSINLQGFESGLYYLLFEYKEATTVEKLILL